MKTRRASLHQRQPGGGLTNTGGSAVVVVMLVITIAGLAWAMERTSYDIWGALWVGPILLLLTVPIANHAAKTESDPRVGRLVMAGAVVKVIGGSVGRYWVDFDLYGGTADSNNYDRVGRQLAPLFRSGNYGDLGEVSSTRLAEILTGQVYALIGPTRLGGYMVFSWLAFLGLYLCWRAFRLAVPTGDHRRYLLLLFFYPTLLLWSSGIGKDAFMVLCLGGAAYGLASLLTGRSRGLLLAVLGLWGAAVMRPHVAVIFAVGALVALPVRLTLGRTGSTKTQPLVSGLLILFVVIASAVVVAQAEDFFDLEQLDVDSFTAVTTDVTERTNIGESTFDSSNPNSPVGYVTAAVTVLFRPFPTEVENLQGLFTAAEGLLLAGVIVLSGRRLIALPRSLIRVPYVTFAVGYVAAFVYAFAAIENFGILARQRTQVLPFVFILLALQAVRSDWPPKQSGLSARAAPDACAEVPAIDATLPEHRP